MDFTAIQGDIAAQRADALVNAAGTSLRMGSGVASALLDAADGPIERDARAKGPVRRGEVVVTDAYELDAKYVIHAVAMSHSGPHRLATPDSVREATHNALRVADERDCESVVIPLLGCGNGGLHTSDGARCVCETVAEYTSDSVTDVRVIAYSDYDYDTLSTVAANVEK